MSEIVGTVVVAIAVLLAVLVVVGLLIGPKRPPAGTRDGAGDRDAIDGPRRRRLRRRTRSLNAAQSAHVAELRPDERERVG